MIKRKFCLPLPGTIDIRKRDWTYLDFITNDQLKDKTIWKRFVSVFKTKEDSADRGWRGEYWGKMMRGACLTYRCTADKDLYDILQDSVIELLDCAEEDGRLSTYLRENEFSGWDIWCRKYVLTGMLHFCDICLNTELSERILDAMEKHLDSIIKGVGPAPGQIPITETSDFWLGVNSCSILEPVLDLYRRRPEKRFLDFSEYIIKTGGCSGGDLIKLALEDKLSPFQYPETKAYETMSFFEGVLAYYEVSGKREYLDAVLKFTEKVFETEITLIGCAGCTHEQFDNAAVCQTEPKEKPMQETCVTVTWMRLCARLFLLTGEEKYADRVERSALNALYGSVNLTLSPITMEKSGERLVGLPFDSYSPLFFNRRGRGVGGLKHFRDGSFYGCCAAIGAAGIAVRPLIDSLRNKGKEQYELKAHFLNGKIALTYGPYVLARDERKESGSILSPVEPKLKNGSLSFELLPRENGENVRIALETAHGRVLLTDYASCGKHWDEKRNRITVWMPTE